MKKITSPNISRRLVLAVYFFKLASFSYASEVKLTANDALGEDNFGYSVAISGDYTIVGAYNDDDNGASSGSVYIFFRDDSTSWSQQAKLTSNDAAMGDYFGRSVSIFGDYSIIGAQADDDGGESSGSAYIFFRSDTTWSQQAKLTASDAEMGDYFGNSVATSGEYSIVGAQADDDGGESSGSAYIFIRSDTAWSQQAKLTADDAAMNDYFGISVSISGNYAIVGAYGVDDNGSASGSAYIFFRSDTTWSQQVKLTLDDAAEYDYFGRSVSISGNYAIVGAYGVDDNGSASGSAYIFLRNGTTWSQQAKLTANDAAAGDYFGRSVSISGDYSIVGAYNDDDDGNASGSSYVFHFADSSWFQHSKLTASDAAENDNFGYSVAISGDYSIVGAYNDDDGGQGSGSAYIYSGIIPAFEISVLPSSIDFDYVIVGEMATEQVIVKNAGTSNLNVFSIAINGADSLNFIVDTTLFTLLPSDSLFLDISFVPDGPGSFNATLNITSNGGTAVITLVGNGSGDPIAYITSVTDVSDDQGSWVYLSWFSSGYDVFGEITQYGIWELNPANVWVSLGNVPAIQEDNYIFLAHTFGDSTHEGIFWSQFKVSSHTSDPEEFYYSPVDSGYSVDNISPIVPTGLLASVTEENLILLTWDPPVDADFQYFKIYRGPTPDFDPSGMVPYTETIDNYFTDYESEIGDTLYYRISTIDFHGNESDYSDAVEAVVLLTSNEIRIPVKFSIYQNYPNPFNHTTNIKYELPVQSDVQITVIDIQGRHVTTLVSETQDAGYNSIIWNASNTSSGTYIYHIKANDFIRTRKMILLK